jgi:hypothetical protein
MKKLYKISQQIINQGQVTIMFKWIIKFFRKGNNKPELVIEQSLESSETTLKQIKNIVEDPREIILNDSRLKLNELKIYQSFFNFKMIDDIFNQTEIIHEIFDNNTKLTFKKLDQYHYYYTVHLIELLSKLKTRVDESSGVLKTQIKMVSNKINTTKKHYNEINNESASLNLNSKIQYASYASMQLSCIYNCLLDKFNDFRLKKTYEYVPYSVKKNSSFINYIIPNDLYITLSDFNKKNQYQWEDFWINRTLMGKLQKNLYLITYEFSIISNSSTIEVFKIAETGDYFSFNPQTFTYDFLDYTKIAQYCDDSNTEFFEINQSLNELQKSETILKAKLDNIINVNITKDIKDVLKKYLLKIEDMELLEEITSINLETKILHTMLELEKLEI